MHDTSLTDSPVLNRRFIRLQAVLHLYAFYVCKEANYNWALDQIHADFIPDVFADIPVDKVQLTQESQQAVALFDSYLASSDFPTEVTESTSSRAHAVATRAFTNYKSERDKDIRKLEGGLIDSVTAINQAYIRIWQLLAEWAYIAQQHAERPKLYQQRGTAAPVAISYSQMLQHLQRNSVLAKLVQQEAAGWQDHLPLVESWYRRFVKQDPAVQQCLVRPMSPHQDEQLLIFLIEDIIFKELDIQAFFSDIDPRWSVHKRIVKKQVRRGLASFFQESEGVSLQILDSAVEEKEEQYFYANLVQKTLQEDVELESLIAQTAKNWSVDRIMLLDKTIIKLALCEMLHFEAIPIKVSINEYIDISKIYSTPKSNQFVNGLLDAVASTLHQGDNKEA